MKNFFSKNLKFLREKKNIDRQKLADDLDVGLSTISCWENGLRSPNIEMLVKIIKYFNIDQDIITKDLEFEFYNNSSSIENNSIINSLTNEEKELFVKFAKIAANDEKKD